MILNSTKRSGASCPFGIAINPNGETAYVSNANSNSVTPIDTATNTTGAPMTVASLPNAIAITPNGETAYVTSYNSSSVTPIDTATNTAGTPIAVLGTWGIAITPDQAPVASFSVTPAPAGSPTDFDASGSTAPSSPIATFAWSFGDGTDATTDVPTVSHTYADAGTYTVTLTLSDVDGTSTTQVFTGQTMSLNGGPGAQTTQTVSIQSGGALVLLLYGRLRPSAVESHGDLDLLPTLLGRADML